MGFQASEGQAVLAITTATFDVLAVPYAADTTSAPLPTSMWRLRWQVSYWMPLFSAPA